MILVKDLLGVGEIDLLFGPLVPRELRDPLEERPDHLVLGRLRARALQSSEFAIDLGPLLLGEVEFGDTVAHLLDVVSLLLFAELLLDRLELLSQEHLTLPFTEFGLDLRLDILLSVDPGELTLDRKQARTHPLLVVEQFKQFLLVGRLQLQVERNQIRKRTRLVHALDQLVQRLGRNSSTRAELSSPIPQLLIQSLEGRVLVVLGLQRIHIEEDGVQHGLAFLVI